MRGRAWLDVIKRTARGSEAISASGWRHSLRSICCSLSPAWLFGVGLIGYVPVKNALNEFLTALVTVAPAKSSDCSRQQVPQIAAGNEASLLTMASLQPT